MPYLDSGLPFSGAIQVSRHASATGAKAAESARAGKTKEYLRLLEERGALSDHAVAALTGWGLSSVNSIRNGVAELVEADGFDTQKVGRKHTKRTLWRVKHGTRLSER